MTFLQSILSSIHKQISNITGTTIVQEESFDVIAVPGLITLLDVILYKSCIYEQITATITSGHNLLYTWLDIKYQSIKLLNILQQYHDIDELNKVNTYYNNTINTTSSHSNNKINTSASIIARYHLMESFARTCLDVACDAIQRMTTDRFSDTANLSSSSSLSLSDPNSYDPSIPNSITGSNTKNENNSSSNNNNNNNNNTTSTSTNAMIATLFESANDTGRRGMPMGLSQQQYRSVDCWESQRLFCPDYIWADDTANHAQRIIRLLLKNNFVTSSYDNNNNKNNNSESSDDNIHSNNAYISFLPILNTIVEQESFTLLLIITKDLPNRIVQFRTSIENDAFILKRLFLIKMEYRAPFRIFLESHQSLQRAPSIALIHQYMNYPKNKLEEHRNICKDRLQQLLIQPYLIEALALEKKCEEYELAMTDMLYGFSELARYITLKRACIIPPLNNDDNDVAADDNEEEDDTNTELICNLTHVRETIRRLKSILCRKAGPDSSTGIRPLLLDLQGIPRDEEKYDPSLVRSYFVSIKDYEQRVNMFVQQLQTLRTLCCYSKRHCFYRSDRKVELDIPSSIVRGCEKLDDELFRCYCLDWMTMVQRQHELLHEHNNFDELAESIRQAEIQMSLAAATNQSLDVVRLRLEAIESDRDKRYQVLKDIVEDVCLREMNIRIRISKPSTDKILALQPTSELGVFGEALQMANETLPLG